MFIKENVRGTPLIGDNGRFTRFQPFISGSDPSERANPDLEIHLDSSNQSFDIGTV